MVFDAAGNLYGTTTDYDAVYGYYCEAGAPCGHVFELSPPPSSGQSWTYSSLWAYTGGADRADPVAPVTIDAQGNLYATAYYFGGSLIKLSPPAVPGGTWTETTVYQFTGNGAGESPYGNVIFGLDGRLYGTLFAGGRMKDCPDWAEGCGVVFALTP